MKYLKRMLVITGLALVCVSSTAQPSLIPDEDGILSIQQNPFDVNNFVIAPWAKFDDQQRGLKYLAECFFNMSNIWFEGTKQNFKLCEELGLSVIVHSPDKQLGNNNSMKMSDEDIDAYVKDMVRHGDESKAIVGYYICDEPSLLAFPKLAVVVKALRKYAPGKMAYINLFPNYATLWTLDQMESQLGAKTYQEYLEQFIEIVKPDIISYDNYQMQYSMDQKDRYRMSQYFTNIMDVRAASIKYHLPWWNVVTGNQIRRFTVIPTLDNMMLQAYTSLAAGAGGMCWYTYSQSGYDYAPINAKEMRTNTWYALREVNRHLSILGPIIKTFKSTGVYFTDPTIHPSLPLLPGKIVKEVDCPEPLMIGEFESVQGNRYVMVVNISLERSARFVLKTNIENERLFVVSTGEQTPYFQEIVSSETFPVSMTSKYSKEQLVQKAYWIPAGQGTLIKCRTY